MSGRLRLWLLLAVACVVSSCQEPSGKVRVRFTFSVDGAGLRQDTMLYQNEAGNRYEVTEAQYFISDMVFTAADGARYAILSDRCAHYVDADLPGTLVWCPDDELPAGGYSAVTFVFGLAPRLNVPHRYTNAPENNMSWPASMGGGYHNMKINGRWLDPGGEARPFNLHSGRLVTADGDTLETSFSVTLPLSGFIVRKDEVAGLVIDMDINRWFCSPCLFDLNVYGGGVMQNAEAQRALAANGWDVFSVSE